MARLSPNMGILTPYRTSEATLKNYTTRKVLCGSGEASIAYIVGVHVLIVVIVLRWSLWRLCY